MTSNASTQGTSARTELSCVEPAVVSETAYAWTWCEDRDGQAGVGRDRNEGDRHEEDGKPLVVAGLRLLVLAGSSIGHALLLVVNERLALGQRLALVTLRAHLGHLYTAGRHTPGEHPWPVCRHFVAEAAARAMLEGGDARAMLRAKRHALRGGGARRAWRSAAQ
eukprot:scaffold41380_cov60-Phaeocystis_antarctica.AAC.1